MFTNMAIWHSSDINSCLGTPVS